VEGVLKSVAVPAPAGRQASRGVVHLKDLSLIAAFPGIDGGAQSRDAAANDRDLPGILSHACQLRSRISRAAQGCVRMRRRRLATQIPVKYVATKIGRNGSHVPRMLENIE